MNSNTSNNLSKDNFTKFKKGWMCPQSLERFSFQHFPMLLNQHDNYCDLKSKSDLVVWFIGVRVRLECLPREAKLCQSDRPAKNHITPDHKSSSRHVQLYHSEGQPVIITMIRKFTIFLLKIFTSWPSKEHFQ